MWGVGPAVSTGKPRSTYWPGGSRAARSSETRRRPVKPREMNSATSLSFRGALSMSYVSPNSPSGGTGLRAAEHARRGDRREPLRLRDLIAGTATDEVLDPHPAILTQSPT